EQVDVVGQVFPGSGDARHHGLAAKLAFGADLARHARHLGGERAQLLDHRVQRFLQQKDLAAHVHGDLLGEIAAGKRGRHFGDIAAWGSDVGRERVDVVGQVFPGAGDARHLRLPAEPPLGADLARDAGDLGGEAVELVDHGVERLLQLKDLAAHVDRDLAREVAPGNGGGHLGDVAHLVGQIAGHGVDAVGQVLPRAGFARAWRLATEHAFGAALAGDARHLAGERVELVHHGIDGVLELENFAAHVDGDLFGKVAAGDGGCDFGDVADLRGQVRGHGVDAVGQVFPGAGDAEHVGLAAQPTFGTDLARDARHLAGKRVELIDHRVDGFLELQNLAAHVDRDLLRQVAHGDRDGDVGD